LDTRGVINGPARTYWYSHAGAGQHEPVRPRRHLQFPGNRRPHGSPRQAGAAKRAPPRNRRAMARWPWWACRCRQCISAAPCQARWTAAGRKPLFRSACTATVRSLWLIRWAGLRSG